MNNVHVYLTILGKPRRGLSGVRDNGDILRPFSGHFATLLENFRHGESEAKKSVGAKGSSEIASAGENRRRVFCR